MSIYYIQSALSKQEWQPLYDLYCHGRQIIVNKTKDQLWSLNAAQLVGNMMYRIESWKKNQQNNTPGLGNLPGLGDPPGVGDPPGLGTPPAQRNIE